MLGSDMLKLESLVPLWSSWDKHLNNDTYIKTERL